jgi:predicted small secreted protein
MGSGRQILIDHNFSIVYSMGIVKELTMKLILIAVVLLTVTACGTVGGAVSGAGKDLSRAGDWIQSK